MSPCSLPCRQVANQIWLQTRLASWRQAIILWWPDKPSRMNMEIPRLCIGAPPMVVGNPGRVKKNATHWGEFPNLKYLRMLMDRHCEYGQRQPTITTGPQNTVVEESEESSCFNFGGNAIYFWNTPLSYPCMVDRGLSHPRHQWLCEPTILQPPWQMQFDVPRATHPVE